MPRRTTLSYSLAAALTVGAVAASPAAATPMTAPADRVDRFEPGPAVIQDGTRKQDLRGERAKDVAAHAVVPGLPTWPTHPEPLGRPLGASTPVNDDSDSGWLLIGLGLAGAGVAAGGAVGVARRYRIQARRVAV